MATVTADKIISVYVKMRDRKDEIKRDMEAKIKEIDDKMELLEVELAKLLDSTGGVSIKTEFGTVYKTVETRFGTNDWPNFYAFVREHDAVDLLEKRIHQASMKQWLETSPDLVPPGLTSQSKEKITVRRK